MASNKTIPCGPCHKGEVHNKADIWCYNCDEGLCSTCSGHHKRFKGTCDHKTIDIKSYQPSIQAIKTECDKHCQQLNLYCPSHLMPCCDECISISHSKCTGIKSLSGVVEKTEIEKSKETVKTDINSILNLLDKIISNKSKNIKTGENQCVRIKKSIGGIKKEINQHLDHLEKTLCEDTDTVWNQEKARATDFISEIEGITNNVKAMKEQFQTVTTHSSKLQSFLGVYQIEQQVLQCQRYVEDLESDERSKEVDIRMKQNEKVEKILSQLRSLESLGEVVLVRTEEAMDRKTSARRKAQVKSQEHSNINNMNMNIETKIKINMHMKKEISNMIFLIDGRVIVVAQRGKINLLTSDFKLEKQLPIPGQAFSVAQINQDTIAITYPGERVIKIFNMENETVTKVIKLDRGCWGLSFSNNSLAVGLHNRGIQIIDLEGNTLRSIQVQSGTDLWNLVSCNDRVIYSDYFGRAVYCYDESGEQIWQYTHDLGGPMGLCTDTYGNIIIADQGSKRMIVISKDGQDSKVLVSKENGQNIKPRCICIRNNESSGVICDYQGHYLAKFNLSHE